MESETTKPSSLNIHQRICAVLAEVVATPKTGDNAFQKYKYIEASMVKAIFRGLLARHGIVFQPEITQYESRSDGGKQSIATLHLNFSLINIDNPSDRLVTPWIAEAADTGDKAVSKAVTAGIKYWLMSQFLVSDKDEPDADAESPEVAPETRQRPAQRTTPASRPALVAPMMSEEDKAEYALVEEQFEAMRLVWHDLTDSWVPIPEGISLEEFKVKRDTFKESIDKKKASKQPVAAGSK